MPAVMSPTAIMAQAFAAKLQSTLEDMRASLKRQLELLESDTRNFKADGSVAGGGTSVDVLPHGIMGARPNRRGSNIQHLGTTGTISIGLGSTQPSINTGLTLLAGASWDGRISGETWQGRVYLVFSAAGIPYSWVETTGPWHGR